MVVQAEGEGALTEASHVAETSSVLQPRLLDDPFIRAADEQTNAFLV